MKKIIIILIFILTSFNLSAQTYSTSQYLYKFSPLAEIIVRNLGMEDKNANGVIDNAVGAGANEGYEKFIEKYGTGDTLEKKEKSIDSGFYANYLLYGAYNFRLEENEIVNYYYLNIRFKYPEETAIIDKEIKTYIYANNLPLVWLDDEKGTVMEAVTKVLGEGWNEKQVTEDEAINLLNRAIKGIKINGRQGIPSNNGGYYTLSELIKNKSGYCFEVAQYGFWFFSELKINSVLAWAWLTSSLVHDVVKLNSGRIIDYFNSSKPYNIPAGRWQIANPLQCLAEYYKSEAEKNNKNSTQLFEQAAFYDKYNINNIALLMYEYYNVNKPDYSEIITIGEYFLKNIDQEKIKTSGHNETKHNLKSIHSILEACYRYK